MNFRNFIIVTLALILFACIASCSKDKDTTPTTTGKFTATVGAEDFSSPDAYILPASSGGTIGVIAKATDGRYFTIAIFEKDFPLNKAVGVQFSPSIAYYDKNGDAYIPKEGTMTITAYGKSSLGVVTNLKGNFSITVTGKGGDITITNGLFDVSKK